MQDKIHQLFSRLTSFVFAVILGFLIIGILIGTAKLFLNLGGLLSVPEITGTYKLIITDVLSLFILVELSRSLADYFEHQRLQLTFILDAGIVFALREIMIKLFNHEIMPSEIYAMSALILVLGILRTATILVFQHEKKILKQVDNKESAS
ncbi:MAG: phosphate-starvation-inducible PsiE family protein [Sedimenticola sp.]|nr:phosphate-starvation-inducible PsiE family protein [Sedimenticola sp.]